MEAAVAQFNAKGKRNFINIALKNADLLCDVFGRGKNEPVLEHQIVETGLIKLYQITGEKNTLSWRNIFSTTVVIKISVQ